MGQHDPTGIIPADNIIMCVTDKDDVVAYLRKLHEVLGESGSGLLIEKAADTVASLGIDCIELPKERWGPDWQARAEAAEAKVARLTEELRKAEEGSISTVQRLHAEWVGRNFAHMTENELMLAHAAGVAEEYFELGQAIGPLVRAAIKRVNKIKPHEWSTEKVSDSLADMLIFASQLAESFNIDLGEVVARVAESVRARDWVAHRAAHKARVKAEEEG